MRWNNPGHADRPMPVAAPGEVLERFIAELDMPPILRLVKIAPESSERIDDPARVPEILRLVAEMKVGAAVVLDRVGAVVAGQKRP